MEPGWQDRKLTPEVKHAWEVRNPVPCNVCGSVPDDWVCEPDHCHSCLAH